MTTALLVNSRKAAAALSISEKTLWSRTAPRGSIPCVRIGSAVRYSVAALERWIAEREAAQQ
jgi:predicted DNA-binding transcriptional regulator AlpA